MTAPLDALRRLAGVLSGEPLTVADVVGVLGGRATDMTGNVIVDAPALDGVSRASVVRAAGGAPAHVALTLAPPVPIAPLEAELGAPARVHADHPGQPDRLVFPTDLGDGPFAVTVIATDVDGAAPSITLRRDPRL